MCPRLLCRSPGALFCFPEEAAMKSLELNYFYDNEAEQFNFYRIPKVLFTGHH